LVLYTTNIKNLSVAIFQSLRALDLNTVREVVYLWVLVLESVQNPRALCRFFENPLQAIASLNYSVWKKVIDLPKDPLSLCASSQTSVLVDKAKATHGAQTKTL